MVLILKLNIANNLGKRTFRLQISWMSWTSAFKWRNLQRNTYGHV